METHIRLNLGRHCIQTECKRLYDKTLSAYFKAEDGPDRTRLENKIELLQKALSVLDFGFLRSRFPALAGNTNAAIDLGLRHDGQIEILINGARTYASEPKI